MREHAWICLRTLQAYITFTGESAYPAKRSLGNTDKPPFLYMRLAGPLWCTRASMISRTACFNSLPEALVGRGACWASTTLGTMKADRPHCLQAFLTKADDNLASLPVISCCSSASSASPASLQAISLSSSSSALTYMHVHTIK